MWETSDVIMAIYCSTPSQASKSDEALRSPELHPDKIDKSVRRRSKSSSRHWYFKIRHLKEDVNSTSEQILNRYFVVRASL